MFSLGSCVLINKNTFSGGFLLRFNSYLWEKCNENSIHSQVGSRVLVACHLSEGTSLVVQIDYKRIAPPHPLPTCFICLPVNTGVIENVSCCLHCSYLCYCLIVVRVCSSIIFVSCQRAWRIWGTRLQVLSRLVIHSTHPHTPKKLSVRPPFFLYLVSWVFHLLH